VLNEPEAFEIFVAIQSIIACAAPGLRKKAFSLVKPDGFYRTF